MAKMSRFQSSVFYILLSLGILLNVFSLIFFKIRISRFYDFEVQRLSDDLNSKILHFSSDSLRLIDSYIYTNFVQSTKSSQISNSCDTVSRPFFEVVDRNISFRYFISDGKAYVDFYGDYYSVGDSFPRGGVITALSRDSIQVDGKFLFLNSRPDDSFTPSHFELPKIKENNT